MLWQQRYLKDLGEITDEALRIAREEPELAPLFLAHYSVHIARTSSDEAEPVQAAVSNLLYMAGHYDMMAEGDIIRTYGSNHLARQVTKRAC